MQFAMKTAALALILGLADLALAVDLPADVAPNNEGTLKVVAASCLGGGDSAALVGAGIEADGTIVLAGQAADFPDAPHSLELPLPANARQPANKNAPKEELPVPVSARGFIVRLSADGHKILALSKFPAGSQVEKLRLDAAGHVFLLVRQGPEAIVVGMPADLGRITGFVTHFGLRDFDVDGNELLLLAMDNLSRVAGNGTERWNVPIIRNGSFNIGGLVVVPQTGAAIVTGRVFAGNLPRLHPEPFVCAYDRAGQPVWDLWNPSPHLDKATAVGGAGSQSGGTVEHICLHSDGSLLLLLQADDANCLCLRDPMHWDKPIDPGVFDGVFMADPAFASEGVKTRALLLHASAANGKLLKGTWLCACPTPTQANRLDLTAATGDAKGNLLVVGNSGSGGPSKDPWYPGTPEGFAGPGMVGAGFAGDGFLAVLDRDCKLIQCGGFAGTNFNAVAARGNTVVIAGNAKQDAGGKNSSLPVYKAVAGFLGSGDRNGYFVVLQR